MKSFTKTINSKLSVIICIIMLSSCTSRKEIAYFQDEPLTENMELTNAYELSYKPDDLVTIDISAADPETLIGFNLPAVAVNSSLTDTRGSLRMQAYLIDSQGNIEFPTLGTIHLGGLTRTEATKMLRETLTEYLKDPIVNIRLTNFTVTVLGEVNRPGTFTIQDERISLSEALGLAGDLTIFGKRENVFLIREVDGEKRYAKIDLTSINTVNSPNYYLTQNDVLYVEPNTAKVRSAGYTRNNSVIISAIGTLATIIAILIK